MANPMVDPRPYGTGRRKTSIARVRIAPGSGKILVNGKEAAAYFGRETLEVAVRMPFAATGTEGRFDVIASVEGGGLAGQAGAVRHGIARALMEADGELRQPLKKAGLIRRDPRMKERRKYGLKKARKAPQYSKR